MTNRSEAAITEWRIDPDVVDDIAQVLDQQALRERSMAAAFLAVGRGGLARLHEKRAVAFEEAAALVREQAFVKPRWRRVCGQAGTLP
jgi:hypothetical protein